MYMLSPNPVNDVLLIEAKEDHNVEYVDEKGTPQTLQLSPVISRVRILDMTYGNVFVDETVNGSKQTSINVAKLPSGTYLAEIWDREQVFSEKFVK